MMDLQSSEKAEQMAKELISGLAKVTEQAIRALPTSLELNGPQDTLALVQLIQLSAVVGEHLVKMSAAAGAQNGQPN